MPIYTYRCPAGHVSERIVISAKQAGEPPATILCHTCNKIAHWFQAAVGRPRFKKGSGGFHECDYGRKS